MACEQHPILIVIEYGAQVNMLYVFDTEEKKVQFILIDS